MSIHKSNWNSIPIGSSKLANQSQPNALRAFFWHPKLNFLNWIQSYRTRICRWLSSLKRSQRQNHTFINHTNSSVRGVVQLNKISSTIDYSYHHGPSDLASDRRPVWLGQKARNKARQICQSFHAKRSNSAVVIGVRAIHVILVPIFEPSNDKPSSFDEWTEHDPCKECTCREKKNEAWF